MTVNSVLAAPLVFGVKMYQRLISPMTSPTCRFYPSCSSYAVTSLVRFGPLRGAWLAIGRIGRCHPWNPGGVDPVPQTWAGRRDVRPEDFRPDNSTDSGSGSASQVAVNARTNSTLELTSTVDHLIDHPIDSDAAATTIRHDCRSVVYGERTTHQTTEELR